MCLIFNFGLRVSFVFKFFQNPKSKFRNPKSIRFRLPTRACAIRIAYTQFLQKILVKTNAVVHAEHIFAFIAFYTAVYYVNGHAKTGGTTSGFIGGIGLPFAGHYIMS